MEFTEGSEGEVVPLALIDASPNVAPELRDDIGSDIVEEELCLLEEEDRKFKKDLYDMGFEVLPNLEQRSDICSVLADALDMTDPSFISLAIAEFLMDNSTDAEVWSVGEILSEEDLQKQIHNFLESDEENGNDKLAALAISKLEEYNIIIHEPGIKPQNYPGNLKFDRTIHLSLHNGLEYRRLGTIDRNKEKDEKFREFLHDEGFKVINIDPDGNCLFSAIGMAMKIRDPFVIRQDIAAYIRAHLDDEEVRLHFVDDGEVIWTDDMRDAWINSIEKDQSEWGNALCILAARRHYDININTYMPPGALIMQPNPNMHEKQTIILSFHMNNHYNLLVNPNESVLDGINYNSDISSEMGANKNQDYDCDNFVFEGEESGCCEDVDLEAQHSDIESENIIGDEESGSDEMLEDDEPDSDNELYGEMGAKNLQTKDGKQIKPSFKYVLSTYFKKGRDNVDVYIFLYGTSTSTMLGEALKSCRSKKIFILIDYCKDFKDKILRDELNNHMTVWRCVLPLPWRNPTRNRYIWLTNLMILPLIMGVSRITWRGFQIRPLFKMGSRAMMTLLLTRVAGLITDDLIDDLQQLSDGTYDLCCDEACNDECIVKEKGWHLVLSDFKRMPFTQPTGHGLLDRLDFLNAQVKVANKVLKRFRRLQSKGVVTISDVGLLLKSIYRNHQRNNWYTSYTILIIDGPKMYENDMADIYSLLKNEDLYKVVYSGCTKNQWLRKGHFTQTKSSVNRYLTMHSRMFFIRKVTFSSFEEARRDEAMCIEILKTNARAYRHEGLQPPYLIANIHSEPMKLLNGYEKMIENASMFSSTKVPVYSSDYTQRPGYDNYDFKGSYVIKEEITMGDGNYKEREFEDAKEAYENLLHVKRM